MGKIVGITKFFLILIVVLVVIIIINTIADTLDNIKDAKFNTEVTKQMSIECSKEADTSICKEL